MASANHSKSVRTGSGAESLHDPNEVIPDTLPTVGKIAFAFVRRKMLGLLFRPCKVLTAFVMGGSSLHPDVAAIKIGPHLVELAGMKSCSICNMPFPKGTQPSISKAFAEHVRTVHKPRQKEEDFSQAAARIVRESTRDNKLQAILFEKSGNQ